MTWARLDDRFHDNRKIKRLWQNTPAALGLHVMALTYCAGNETDGLVDPEFVEEKTPQPKERARILTALTDSGLWVAEDEGWRIHDYLDFNPSKETLDQNRSWDRKRKELFRDPELIAAIRDRDRDRCRYCGVKVNWKDRRGDHGGTYDHVTPRGDNTLENVVVACRKCNLTKGARTPAECGMSLLDPSQVGARSGARSDPAPVQNGDLALSSHPSRPVPTRPDLLPPDPPRGARQRDADRFEEEVRTYATNLLPDENPADALSAVRSALGTLRDRGLVLSADVVRSEAAFWLGKDETGLSEDARERLRQLGDRFSAFNRNAEAS